MKQFAVAIIGCGNVSRMHFEAYLRLCWLLGISVCKMDSCALDFCIGFASVAFVEEGIQAHFAYL